MSAFSAGNHTPFVTVLIPTFNMGWCIASAIESCLSQSRVPDEVIVIDDASTDETPELLRSVCAREKRVRYLRRDANGGHLAALNDGMSAARGDWIALLDADDVLTRDSISVRLDAAVRYHTQTGEWPGLVYGDLVQIPESSDSLVQFTRLAGHAYSFVIRELSLCQTSTIMLSRAARAAFPPPVNPYNTDDDIVIRTARKGALVHCGSVVTAIKAHGQPSLTSFTGSSRLAGIRTLVRDHRADIIAYHGYGRLALWQLRCLRVALELARDQAQERSTRPGALLAVRGVQARLLVRAHAILTAFLARRFAHLYF